MSASSNRNIMPNLGYWNVLVSFFYVSTNCNHSSVRQYVRFLPRIKGFGSRRLNDIIVFTVRKRRNVTTNEWSSSNHTIATDCISLVRLHLLGT